VVGQADFASAGTGTTDDELKNPRGIAVTGTKLIVSDRGNHRILIWDPIPTDNGEPADVVLGQADFVSGSQNAGNGNSPAADDTLSDPWDVYTDGTALYAADTGNNRVLIWNTIPTVDQTPADKQFGQDNFTDVAINHSGGGVDDDGFDSPRGVWSDGVDLWTTEHGNHRVLNSSVP